MKAGINNENKAKFFALYWGQEIMGTDIFPKPQNCYVATSSLDRYYLNLKPLSSISDQDLAKLPINKQFVRSEFWKNDVMLKGLEDRFRDQLRALGYALSWMGLSVDQMVKAGWIKLIES